jgi:hypothetical protein
VSNTLVLVGEPLVPLKVVVPKAANRRGIDFKLQVNIGSPKKAVREIRHRERTVVHV